MDAKQQQPGFDKNVIIALVLCGAIWFAWQNYMEKKYPEAMNPHSAQQQAPTANGNTGASAGEQAAEPASSGAETKSTDKATAVAAKAESVAKPKGQETFWHYEDDNWKVTVSSFQGRVSEIILKKYTDQDGKPISLVKENSPGYLTTQIEGIPTGNAAINYAIKPLGDDKIELDGTSGATNIRKTYTIEKDKYAIDVESEITGQTSSIKRVDFSVAAPAPDSTNTGSVFSMLFSGGGDKKSSNKGPDFQEYFFSYASKTDRVVSTTEKRVDKNTDQTHFASVGSRYFTTLLFNRGDVLPQAFAIPAGPHSVLEFSYHVLNPSSPITNSFTMYAGPKLLNELQKVDETAGQVVDLGKFSWIAIPLLKLMRLLYDLFGNWGFAIVGLTILVRGVTYPFTYMSYRSMRAMQKIQPEMTRVRAKYKDNPTVMNQEVMRLWKENKVNPMGGCLPVVLQLPVFWALYTVLQNSIELYHAPFIFWIHDLSIKDPYYVTPVLMGITMFIQQRMTPNTMDPAQAKMMMIMPIFFSFLMMNLPSGLTLYIFISTLFGIVQQYFNMKDRQRTPPSSGSPVTVMGSVVKGTSK